MNDDTCLMQAFAVATAQLGLPLPTLPFQTSSGNVSLHDAFAKRCQDYCWAYSLDSWQYIDLSSKPGHHDSFFLIGLRWLCKHSELRPPPPPNLLPALEWLSMTNIKPSIWSGLGHTDLFQASPGGHSM